MLVSSVIAVSIACANVSTRMWYRMGADGAFPKWFGMVHPTRKTPINAIIAQWVLADRDGHRADRRSPVSRRSPSDADAQYPDRRSTRTSTTSTAT